MVSKDNSISASDKNLDNKRNLNSKRYVKQSNS